MEARQVLVQRLTTEWDAPFLSLQQAAGRHHPLCIEGFDPDRRNQ
jgi:hypothetical protein